jgi:hypothetical protein
MKRIRGTMERLRGAIKKLEKTLGRQKSVKE